MKAQWQGRLAEELATHWGQPDGRSKLADGRQQWEYIRTTTTHADGHYRDDTRTVNRWYSDGNGQPKDEVNVDTVPVWVPPKTTTSRCDARFIIGATYRIEQIVLNGEGCAALPPA